MIKGIVTGVDNLLVRKDLILNEQNLSELKYRIQDLKERNIKFSLVTGRSLDSSKKLLETLSVTDICGFEMGLHLYNPVTEESYDLLDHHDDMKDVKSGISKMREYLLSEKKEIEERLGESINYLDHRKRIRTFETNPESGIKLYKVLRELIPVYISELISKNHILMFPSSKAVDIMPNLTKGDAVLAILSRYELQTEDFLACSVSYHTDHEMLKNCGYASCTSNADNGCKFYIKNERKEKGYVSKLSFTEGAVDIINKVVL